MDVGGGRLCVSARRFNVASPNSPKGKILRSLPGSTGLTYKGALAEQQGCPCPKVGRETWAHLPEQEGQPGRRRAKPLQAGSESDRQAALTGKAPKERLPGTGY